MCIFVQVNSCFILTLDCSSLMSTCKFLFMQVIAYIKGHAVHDFMQFFVLTYLYQLVECYGYK